MRAKSFNNLLSASESFGLSPVSQGMWNPSQMKAFHPKHFMQVGNHCLWRGTEGHRRSASCCMWVSLEAISESFMETGGGWSFGHLFIGKIFSSSSNCLNPKKTWLLFIAAPRYTFSERSQISFGRIPSLSRNRMRYHCPTFPEVSLFALGAIPLILVSVLNSSGTFLI